MKIVIPGGSGQVGTIVARAFHGAGDEVVVLSRNPRAGAWREVEWDGENIGDWQREFEAADAVINLAGRSVNCRYNAVNRAAIMDSRVHSTRVVGEAIAQCAAPPRVWLQAGTATIYSHRYDAPNDEATGIIGGGEPDAPDKWNFSIEVAKAWERTLEHADTPATRKVILRSAMTMSPDRGAIFDTLLRLVRLGLGGSVAGGRQYVSWIHETDFVRAVRWLIENEDLSGLVNLASPNPLPYTKFMAALRNAWRMPIGLPATRWMVEIGTRIMRTESELVLKSRRVVPRRLISRGFAFEYPDWPEAAEELCRRWRETTD